MGAQLEIRRRSLVEGVWIIEWEPTCTGRSLVFTAAPPGKTYEEKQKVASFRVILLELLTEQKSINIKRLRFRCTVLGLHPSLSCSLSLSLALCLHAPSDLR